MRVMKVGAVTGTTEGTVVDIDLDNSFGTFRFDNQIMIDSGSDNIQFGIQGDSGSLVVDESSNRATALIFEASGRFDVSCPLDSFTKLESSSPLHSQGLTRQSSDCAMNHRAKGNGRELAFSHVSRSITQGGDEWPRLTQDTLGCFWGKLSSSRPHLPGWAPASTTKALTPQ
jgi:hypothetical protein